MPSGKAGTALAPGQGWSPLLKAPSITSWSESLMESAPWTPMKWEIRPAQVQYLLGHQQPENLCVLKCLTSRRGDTELGLNFTMTKVPVFCFRTWAASAPAQMSQNRWGWKSPPRPSSPACPHLQPFLDALLAAHKPRTWSFPSTSSIPTHFCCLWYVLGNISSLELSNGQIPGQKYWQKREKKAPHSHRRCPGA